MKRFFLILVSLFVIGKTEVYSQWSGTNPLTTGANVGIGTASPNVKLEIRESMAGSLNKNVMLQLSNNWVQGGLNEPTIKFDNGGGSEYWTIGAQVSGQDYFRISHKGWQSNSVEKDVLFINGDGKVVIGNANHSGNPSGTISYFGDYRLYVERGILTEGLKIAMSNDPTEWADYVFDENYKLMPLSSVKNYIEREKHLPNMPSTCELQENGGVDVKKVMAKQQEKIEELYLYILELKAEIDELKTCKD